MPDGSPLTRVSDETDHPSGIKSFVNNIHQGDAAEVMARMPSGSTDLIITSPPYWTAVKYDDGSGDGGDTPGQWPSYEAYLEDICRVWVESARVLRPNGKLCINAPLMPIPKEIIPQHTRHLKDIAADIGHMVLSRTDLERYGLFIWQKQTSKMMFGSYPFPGNIIENNTVEMINIYVKPGKPPKFDSDVKEANRLSREEWLDLTQQVWFMYPEDVKRDKDHPAPFPQKLPARLIRLYTFGAFSTFPGEIVLDPFAGTGTTCAVAKTMRRRWIGIDIVPRYVALARTRVHGADEFQPLLLVGRAKYPTTEELLELAANSSGKEAEVKHKRKTYGRGVSRDDEGQLKLV
ncbi:MAG: site-specific DNA-methyltransferase [Acetobacteraceae bacterium]|nr:site-specific DNA-methyltransferase [Acetobacteraceae bacterium]